MFTQIIRAAIMVPVFLIGEAPGAFAQNAMTPVEAAGMVCSSDGITSPALCGSPSITSGNGPTSSSSSQHLPECPVMCIGGLPPGTNKQLFIQQFEQKNHCVVSSAPMTAPTASSLNCHLPSDLTNNNWQTYLNDPSHSNNCDQMLYLATTIYGEAEGQNLASKIAVGWVIRNRVDANDPQLFGGGGDTYEDVTKNSGQFDCWYSGPNNIGRTESATGPAWQQ